MRWPIKKLLCWQKAFSITKNIYQITEKFPKKEIFWITNQLRRAAVSIVSNIAEWNAKSSDKHFKLYLENSLWSIYEVQTQYEIAKELWYTHQIITLEKDLDECAKLIWWLIKKLDT